MKIALIDTNVLISYCSDNTISETKRKLEYLFNNYKVIIPTPVFSEFLIRISGKQNDIFEALENQQDIVLAPFDRMAAIECAEIHKTALRRGNKRNGTDSDASWQKVKIDRQIVAIGIVHHAQLIVSEDGDVSVIAQNAGIQCMTIEELPSQLEQGDFFS